MKITTVTVGLRRTESLPEYRNVAPSLTLSAEIEPGDDWPQVEQRLKSEVEQIIEDWIDDELEKVGQPAKFSKEPRYDLWHWTSADILAILPTGWDLDDLLGHWRICQSYEFCGRNHRLTFLKRTVEQIRKDGQMQVSGDGEFLSLADLDLWTWQYLTQADVWSIVQIKARLAEGHGLYSLGNVAVCGDTMLDIMEDESLQWELGTGRSVGTRAVIADIITGSTRHIPIAETPSDFDIWVQERLSELNRERQAELEAERAPYDGPIFGPSYPYSAEEDEEEEEDEDTDLTREQEDRATELRRTGELPHTIDHQT